jgi:DNA polymerase-3 subunit alpha
MPSFAHLHCHTQFSLLDGAASIKNMFKKATDDGMTGLAITDHGNMFGVFEFMNVAEKFNKNNPVIKPITGCEFYLVNDRHKKNFTREEKDKRYHQLFLAKNATGYNNLVKLCSLGYVEGQYGKYPRIDKELVLQYHEGLIATTCCIGAEVPKAILQRGEDEAEKVFTWWLDLFGEDYYIELQRHQMPEQEKVNSVLLKWAKKYGVKTIATNDSHYLDKEDANAHDILLCINTGEKKSTPSMKEFNDDEASTRGYRFAFFNDEFYLKTTAEMNNLFKDIPEAIDHTNEIVSKVETLKLKKDILLPHYKIPEGFTTQDQYLAHLTFEGAGKRYGIITPEINDRIIFELNIIEKMGFAGYFLIVSDFIQAGRNLGVFVGPGRGSAAGSVVAYCIGITNIDPIRYGLLFERFLNPDRKSMPDIDTDFDDEGRQKVIDYVVEKYGKNQVAQIVTYGTMAAKSSIKDVARVLDLPLNDSNMLSKLIPEKPGISLKDVLYRNLEGKDGLKESLNLSSEEIDNVAKIRTFLEDKNSLHAEVLHEAVKLEGSVRNTGIHAAGIIIAPRDLTEIIPVCTAKDADLYVSQYEGNLIEDAGVIKMDFLGLKTLSILKDALNLIKERRGVDIDLDTLPLDDSNTYRLYQLGETNGTFQFESVGMQKHLKELKPDRFEDLIAMNALYRPGPIAYIPQYIKRKHGKEEILYDLPEMKEFLEETYGVTVYQEQVMLLAQKLAGFTKGMADRLRKAMGKKLRAELDALKEDFMQGTAKNGYPEKICEKIWKDWEAFAEYAFNKSHSTCYALVAYQTAFLKANYPEEYMAALLTNSGNIEKTTFFMEECRRMGVPVLGPDINESDMRFSVNAKGEIRFALSAIKGFGEAAGMAIIEERQTGGPFQTVFDLCKRVSSSAARRNALEPLAYAGAFDSFGLHRAQYFHTDEKEKIPLIEKAIRFGAQWRANQSSNQFSLFGEGSGGQAQEPPIPKCEDWPHLAKLKLEKEAIGMYVSGHPLDDYQAEIKHFTHCSLNDIEQHQNRDIRVAGIVSATQVRMSKNGNNYVIFSLEDFDGSREFKLFNRDFLNYRHFFDHPGAMVMVNLRYQPTFYDPNKYETKISRVELLSEIRDNHINHITIHLPIEDITESMVADLEKLLTAHSGKTAVHFLIEDNLENYSVPLRAKKMNVQFSTALLKSIENLGINRIRINN